MVAGTWVYRHLFKAQLSIIWGYRLGSGGAASYGKCSRYLRDSIAHHCGFPPVMCQGFGASTFSATLLILHFLIAAFLVGWRQGHATLMLCVCPLVSGVEHLLKCVLATPSPSLLSHSSHPLKEYFWTQTMPSMRLYSFF